jgi:type VI secretion system protein ImpC
MTDDKNLEKEQLTQQGAIEVSELDQLLAGSFKPKSDNAKKAVESAVRTLVEQALGDTMVATDDAVNTIESIISNIDQKMTEQINLIMHHEDFKTLEGSWRGLHHLVTNTETDETLKLRVMNIKKEEVAKTIKKFKGTNWDQSPLFKKIYEDEYGVAGGEPYGCLVTDYYFNHSPKDIGLLKGMAQIGAAAHCPIIAGTDPSLMNMDSWQELSNPRDLTKIFQSPEYAPWRSFRASEDSRYVSLAMPRFLSRQPYSIKDNPIDEFNFDEDTGGADHSKFVWSNSAYAMATNINQAFKFYGWCSRIRGVESGGMVEGLPCHTFNTDDGGVAMKCPTEIAITDRREAELSKNGMMPLLHWKNTDYAVFIGAQTLHQPAEYDDPDATANANLGARLPYLFATCRFAHYLKCIVRDKIGSDMERDDMQKFLNKWIMQYVTSDSTASQEMKARYPLAAAEVQVEEVEGNPGYYSAKFFLRPHYQLEGLSVSLRLVSKLPSKKEQ